MKSVYTNPKFNSYIVERRPIWHHKSTHNAKIRRTIELNWEMKPTHNLVLLQGALTQSKRMVQKAQLWDHALWTSITLCKPFNPTSRAAGVTTLIILLSKAGSLLYPSKKGSCSLRRLMISISPRRLWCTNQAALKGYTIITRFFNRS